MSKSSITIQINSVEALERLIGGSTETELALRNSIVQEFTKKHLKALAESTTIATTLKSIQAEIQNEIDKQTREKIGEVRRGWHGISISLNPDFKSELAKVVDERVKLLIANTVADAINKWDTEYVREVVNQRVDYYAKSFVNQQVKHKLEAALKTLEG